MCVFCQISRIEVSNLYRQGQLKIDSLTIGDPITSPIPELEAAPYNTQTTGSGGNAVFNIEWTTGEYYVGKTISIPHIITDPDGFDPANVTIKWFQISGNQYDPSSPIETNSNTYTIQASDVGFQIAYEISFVDDTNIAESFFNYHSSVVTSNASETPNASRSVFTYDDFSTYLSNNNLSSDEASIRTIADTFQGKWGGGLGTAPTQLTYSITPAGQVQYSSLQVAEHPLYADIHTNSGVTAALNAQAFSSEDVVDIKQALDDWTKMTGISFVENSGLGSKADIVFTKLDFQAWYDAIYNGAQNVWIDPGSAGFAFTPSIMGDFITGDIFLSDSLVARNLDPTVYDLTSPHVTTPGFYVLRGDDTNGYDAYSVNYDSGSGKYTMATPENASETNVFGTKAAIYAAGLTIEGYLDGGMSMKGVASHEIGHALGLAHPHDGHDAVGDGNSPWSDDLVKSYDTVMSYEGEGGFQADTPMMYDYLIMKGLYGGSTASTGDNNYTYYIDDFNLEPGQSGFYIREMLHDPDGVDSVTLASQIRSPGVDGVYFNLNSGTASNFKNKTLITDSATKLANANLIVSDVTEIENLTTTEGDDIVDATVGWAVNVNLGNGDDTVTTNGNGGVFLGGSGSDRLTIHSTDFSTLYVQSTSATAGSMRHKSDDSLFCEGSDFEFIELVEGVSSPVQHTSWSALAQLMPPTSTSSLTKAEFNGDGSVLTIYIDDSSITSGSLAEGKLYIDDTPVSPNAGTWASIAGTTSTYTITGTAGDYTTATVVGWETSGDSTFTAGTDDSVNAVAAQQQQTANPISKAEFNADGSQLTITINDASITSGSLAEAKLYINGSPVSANAGAFNAGTPSKYVISGTAGDYTTATVVGWETSGDSTFTDGTDFKINAVAAPVGYDASVFEIVRVPLADGGGRYGAIETFGIQLKDDGDGTANETSTFSNIDLQIEWEQGEYMFWGNYQPGTNTPTNGDIANPDELILSNIANVQQNPNADTLNLAFYSTNGVSYSEGDYLATFMMERTDTSGATSNDISIETSQYNLTTDATAQDPIPTPRSPVQDDFTFDYSSHAVKMKLANARGEEANDPKLFVANGSVSDGLSIVPVAKAGHFVKYEVVLNISRPTFIDTGAAVASAQAIQISGAKIFKESIVDKTGLALAGSQTEEVIGTSTATIKEVDDTGTAVASTKITAATITAAGGLKGHEFFELAKVALDPSDTSETEASLGTIDGLYLSFDALTKPTTTVAANGSDAEGRYVLAEFVAYSGTGPDISYSSGKDTGSGMVLGSTIDIEHRGDSQDATDAANPAQANNAYTTFWEETVADGSDIVVLGEAFYINPENHYDAIGAEDALGALMISNDSATNGDTYSQAQIIAADFNQSGAVSSADAFDILQYSVFGETTNGLLPKWVYIDDIGNSGSTGGASGAVVYDSNIDLFVGAAVNVDATAVLIGDVSESYQPLTNDDPVDYLEYTFENFMNREYVDVDPTATFPTTAILTQNSTAYDNDGTAGVDPSDGDAVAVDYVPEHFLLASNPTGNDPGTAFTLDNVNWHEDVVISGEAAPDNYDRWKYDTTSTDTNHTIPLLAAEVFASGEKNALMLDYHDGNTPLTTQVFMMDLDSDGALTAADMMIVFTNVNKDDFWDGYSITFTG